MPAVLLQYKSHGKSRSSLLTEQPALLVACHFSQRNKVCVFTGGTQLLLQQFRAQQAQWEPGKGHSRNWALTFGVFEAGFVELCLRGLAGRKQCLNLCVEALGLCWLAPPVAAVPVPPGSIWDSRCKAGLE